MATNLLPSEHFCEACNCRVIGLTALRQHLESKAHRRHEMNEDQFVLNAEDMYFDDDAPTVLLLNKFKFSMIGMEHIVEDRTNDEIKCVLCRVLLKTTTLVDHLKSYKHQQTYVERVYPEEYRNLQLKCQKKGDLTSLLQITCESLLRKYGRQRIRIYEKGYAEKRRQQIVQNRLKESTFTECAANVDEFEELPKNERVIQMLLNSKLESFKEGDSAFVSEVIKHIPGAVIGLEYVAEYRDPKEEFEPGYLCTTCESLLNSAQLVTHLVSDKHRLKYMERNYKNFYSLATFRNFPEERKKELLLKYTHDIEKMKGRGSVTLKLIVSDPDATSLFRYHKRIKNPNGGNDVETQSAKPTLSTMTASAASATSSSTTTQSDNYAALYARFMEMQRSFFSAMRGNAGSSGLPNVAGGVVPPMASVGVGAQQQQQQLSRLPSTVSMQQAHNVVGPKFIPLQTSSVAVQPYGTNSQMTDGYSQLAVAQAAPHPYATATASQNVYQLPNVAVQSQVRPTVIQPRKPTHVYSEKTELMHKQLEWERTLPPFRERNVESGWYSERMYTMDYYFQLAAPLNPAYLSVRYPQANPNIYCDFSPYLMRRLQDQFNFEIEHLAWLADQFVRWRMPMYEPLTPVDLRPLEEEVEQAVLDVLVYRTLKPTSVSKNRKLIEYPSPARSSSPSTSADGKDVLLYDYNHKFYEPSCKRIKRSSCNETQPSFAATFSSSSPHPVPDATAATSSVTELDVDEKKSDASSAVVESSMMTVCEQVLETARSTGVNNPVLRLLLNFDNAEKVLYHVAIKEPECLSKIVCFVQNPNEDISANTLNEFKQIFNKFSKF